MGAAYSATTIITLAVEIRRKTVEHVVTHYINIVNHSQPLLLQKLDELICEKQTGPVLMLPEAKLFAASWTCVNNRSDTKNRKRKSKRYTHVTQRTRTPQASSAI